MGKRSDLTIPHRGEIVLMLLRREEPAAKLARPFGRFTKDIYRHVRIQYRTPTQLGLLERFHRKLKEEEVYWRLYDSPAHCRACLEELRQRSGCASTWPIPMIAVAMPGVERA